MIHKMIFTLLSGKYKRQSDWRKRLKTQTMLKKQERNKASDQ